MYGGARAFTTDLGAEVGLNKYLFSNGWVDGHSGLKSHRKIVTGPRLKDLE